ncbi:MAG: hypothetical protein ACP5PJ_06025 [Acidimicrobiales bacterium]
MSSPELYLVDAIPKAASLLVDRYVPVDMRIQSLLPGGGLRKGAAIRMTGVDGDGLYGSIALMIGEATRRGLWVALVNLGDLGFEAMVQSGVDLARVVVISDVTAQPQTLQGVVEAFPVVVSGMSLSPANAQRLLGRVRERETAFIAVERTERFRLARSQRFPASVELTLQAKGGGWSLGNSRDSGQLLRSHARRLVLLHKGHERSVSADVS